MIHVPDPGGLIRGRLIAAVHTHDGGDAAYPVFSEPLADRSLGGEKTIVLGHYDVFANRARLTYDLVRVAEVCGERLFRQYR
jgi:hypothetical protein